MRPIRTIVCLPLNATLTQEFASLPPASKVTGSNGLGTGFGDKWRVHQGHSGNLKHTSQEGRKAA